MSSLLINIDNLINETDEHHGLIYKLFHPIKAGKEAMADAQNDYSMMRQAKEMVAMGDASNIQEALKKLKKQ